MPRACFTLAVLTAIFLPACGSSPETAQMGACQIPSSPLYDEVFAEITAPDDAGAPAYRSWPLFPGTEKLHRLGLPVHGRWTTVYVDPDVAYPFLENATENGATQPLELPAGAKIVKENYRSNFDSETIAPDDSALGVLTVMVKPSADQAGETGVAYAYPCATSHLPPYNGDPETGCLGGRWFYGFYKVTADGPAVQCDTSTLGKYLNAQVNGGTGSFCVHCHAPAYKTDYLRILDDDLNPRTVSPGPPPSVTPVAAPPCDATPSPDLPNDVPANPLAVWQGPGGPEAAKKMVDCFSWRTFTALSWPADPDNPGRPDRSKSASDIGSVKMVWESYSPVYTLFSPGDLDFTPPPFGAQPPIDAPGCSAEDAQVTLTLGSKARDIANETGQAFAGTFGNLIDRNKNIVQYEVLINEVEYDYLVDNGYTDTAKLTPAGPAGAEISFPWTAEDPRNAIEIKSAWKILCTGEDCKPVDDPADYYAVDALIYNEETQSCDGVKQVGLIGLHVAVKTFWAPQWVWATFSHDSNAPVAGTEETASDQYSFYDPNLAPPSDAPPCWTEPFLISAAGCPNVVIDRFEERPDGLPDFLPPPDQPNQITRLVPPPPEVDQVNAQFHQALAGTPLEHYILVDSQWPLNGQTGTRAAPAPNHQACEGDALGANCLQIVPGVLRNPVVESYMATYLMQHGEIEQVSNRGCLNCHMIGPNGSYVWLDAVGVRVPTQQ